MLITPATRLTALLIVEGPLTFRAIIAAHEARNGIEFLADPELYDLHPVGYSDQEAMTDYPPIEEQFTPDWIEAQANFDAGLGH